MTEEPPTIGAEPPQATDMEPAAEISVEPQPATGVEPAVEISVEPQPATDVEPAVETSAEAQPDSAVAMVTDSGVIVVTDSAVTMVTDSALTMVTDSALTMVTDSPTMVPDSVTPVVEETPGPVANDPEVVGTIDYDKTHPYRQKNLVAAVQKLLPSGTPFGTYDLRAVRIVHSVADEGPFCHRLEHEGRQYSQAFADWIADQWKADDQFFAKTRVAYQEYQKAKGA